MFRVIIVILISLVWPIAYADSGLAKPQDINLKGNIRVSDMNSALGAIELRWPRSIEQLFGRTPERAMADAAATVSRALQSAAFPPALQRLSQTWSIVFMDADHPISQVPTSLLSNCHPGWMTPPANIYIVAQKVANFCSGQKVEAYLADSRLAQVLIHEIGHAVEYQLLNSHFEGDRMRAEGFASWFEQFASDYSSVISRGSVKDYYSKLARGAIAMNPNGFQFSGTANDYARAALYFRAVEERRGVSGILSIYKTMQAGSASFVDVLKSEMAWDTKRLNDEMNKLVK